MKNRTLSFGEGLFETFRVYKGRKLAFVDDHLDRMAEGCRFFKLPFSREEALDALRSTLGRIPDHAEARLRLSLVPYGNQRVERTMFETSWEPLHDDSAGMKEGVRLTMAPFERFSRSPLVRFKTTSYMENIFVLSWARRQGFFDALFSNERGEITEGSISNVFFLSKGRIFTPPVEAGLLPGITRKHIIEVARMLGISVAETTVLPPSLGKFDGAFVSNSVIEMIPISAVGDTSYEKIPEEIEALWKGYRSRLHDSPDFQ